MCVALLRLAHQQPLSDTTVIIRTSRRNLHSSVRSVTLHTSGKVDIYKRPEVAMRLETVVRTVMPEE